MGDWLHRVRESELSGSDPCSLCSDYDMGSEAVHLLTLLYISLTFSSNCFHFWSKGLEIVELFSFLEMRENDG